MNIFKDEFPGYIKKLEARVDKKITNIKELVAAGFGFRWPSLAMDWRMAL